MNKRLIIIITAIALIIRLIYVNYPPLLWDEASLGYNAYSILKTGRDEYGQFLPYIFKSFGDYKPGFYVYLTMPFVAILGLNPLAVRLPSIILGSLLPLLFYLLILRLNPKSNRLALISALILALNPWNIHYSRGAWETNVLLFELVMACYLYLTPRYFLSAIVFGLTLYTYQGGKIMSPLLILILFIINYRQIFSNQNILKFVLPLFIFSIPIISGMMFSHDSNRLQVFGLWSYQQPTSEVSQIIHESSIFDYELFHNGFIFFTRNFFVRYFNHFSPKFLAFEGDWQIGRQSAPYIGMLLFPTFIFFFIGIFRALSQKKSNTTIFFLLWLIIGPLPAALTLDIIQPVRTLTMTIPLIYFAAVGISYFIDNWRLLTVTALVISYSVCFYYYSDLYYNHMVKVKPEHWLFGYQQAADFVVAHQNGKQVTFSDFYGQPYIYYLFAAKYDPAKYQLQSHLTVDGLDTGKVERIDNISFTTPDFKSLSQKPNQLMMLTYDDALRQGINLNNLTPLSPINGHSSFYAYETN